MKFERLRTAFLNGKGANYILATGSGNEKFKALHDQTLRSAFTADPGGILMDMKATAAKLAGPMGKYPVEFVAGFESGATILVTPNHTGWQYGEFVVQHGMFYGINYDTLINGRRWVMWWNGSRWLAKEFIISSGYFQDDEDVIASFSMTEGWSATPIVINGNPVPVRHILHQPRTRCDARNLVDFSNGKTVDPEFFQLIRPLLPTDSIELLALLDGADLIVSRSQPMSDADFQRLQQIISEYRLSHLEVGRLDQRMWLTVKGQLPLQRMPLVATGYNAKGQFMAVVVDGRQPDSVGCTITELGQIMAYHGAVFASLGGGGGDAFIGQKLDNGLIKPLNTPSNEFSDGTFGAARRSPNALVIY